MAASTLSVIFFLPITVMISIVESLFGGLLVTVPYDISIRWYLHQVPVVNGKGKLSMVTTLTVGGGVTMGSWAVVVPGSLF